MSTLPDDDARACAGCSLSESLKRREFLRDSVAGALLAIFPLSTLESLPVNWIAGAGPRAEKVYPFPATDGVAIDRDESVIIARFDGRVWAFSLACPHQNTAIRWDAGARRFQCPKHKSRYRPDGTFIEGRATRGLDRFALRRDRDQLLVNLDALYREDKEPGQWSSALIMIEK